MPNIIKAKQAVDDGKMPYKMSTLYGWHNKNKYPSLLFKVAGSSLMIDLSEWDRLVNNAKKANIERVEKLNKN